MSNVAQERAPSLQEILRGGQLETLFQPIVSAEEGKLFAYEALLRGPAGTGLEAPMELFAVSRRAGRIRELDLTALETAVRLFAAHGFRGKLFINMMPQTLITESGFPNWLDGVLRTCGMSPDQLVIEVTEHGEDIDFLALRQRITSLQALGAQIAIDDFGTGLSGLKAWSELRPDFVKIDRYFTSKLLQDPIAIEILRPMLDIAHVLGSRVIAEGIEDERQLELLRGIGVDYLQGFHISHPVREPGDSTGTFVMSPLWSRSQAGANCVGDLCVNRDALPPSARVSDAVALFQDNPDWETLPVVADERPIGLLRRDALLLLLSRPLHPEVYGSKPVSRVMETSMLVIDERTRLSQASRLVTRDRSSRLSEDFVIVREGRYLGLGRGIELLHHITEQQLQEAQHSNPLTLLPGNREIDAEVLRVLALRTPFVICHADIDHFKPFNDEYGYSRGDQVLLHLAALCRSVALEGMDFVGHTGGDDFILIMRSQDWRHRVAKVVDNFSASSAKFYSEQHRIDGGFMGHDREGSLRMFPIMTLSVGAALVDPGRYGNMAELMRALSTAKQRAKSRRGNVVVLNDGDQDHTVRLRVQREASSDGG